MLLSRRLLERGDPGIQYGQIHGISAAWGLDRMLRRLPEEGTRELWWKMKEETETGTGLCLISSGHWVLQTGWFDQQKVLSVLKAGSPRSGCQHG
jgi:hypothetical protein